MGEILHGFEDILIVINESLSFNRIKKCEEPKS